MGWRERTRMRRLEREDAPVCDRGTTRCNLFSVPSVARAAIARIRRAAASMDLLRRTVTARSRT